MAKYTDALSSPKDCCVVVGLRLLRHPVQVSDKVGQVGCVKESPDPIADLISLQRILGVGRKRLGLSRRLLVRFLGLVPGAKVGGRTTAEA